MTKTWLSMIAGLALSVPAAAQRWEATNGPWGGDVSALAAVGPGEAFAGVANRIYYTQDEGKSWKEVGAFPYHYSVRQILRHQGALFAQTSVHGLWRSLDNGQSWQQLSSAPHTFAATSHALWGFIGGYPASTLVRSTDRGTTWTQHPVPGNGGSQVLADGDTLYVGTPGELMRSTDEGQTWIDVGVTGLVMSMARGGNSLYAYAMQNKAVYRSTDDGRTWHPASGGLPFNADVRALGGAGEHVFASTYSPGFGNGLFRAEGDRWAPAPVTAPTSWSGGFVKSIAGWDSRVLLGTAEDVFGSIDGGQTVASSSPGMNASSLDALAGRGSLLLGATRQSGILHRSLDGGGSWSEVSTGFGRFESLLMEGGLVLAGTERDGIHRSTDGGLTWTPSRDGLPVFNTSGGPAYESVRSIVRTPGSIVAALGSVFIEQGPGYFVSPGGLARSTDNGATWQRMTTFPIQGFNQGQPIHHEVQALASGAGAIWAQTYAGLYRSTNGGASWSPADSGLTICQSAKAHFGTMVEVNGEMLGGVELCMCACSFPTAVYRWSPATSSWVPSDTGLPGMQVNQLLVRGSDVYAVTGSGYGFQGPGTGLYRSTDGGHTWTLVGSATRSVDILAANDQGVFATWWNGGVSKLSTGAPWCYANCDHSVAEPRLNVADFSCFLGKYAAGDPWANCDASAAAPVLNVADFSCFLQKYAAGCP